MAKHKYTIRGTVANQKHQYLSGLRIEAWDNDLIIDDLLGTALTDQDGKFAIQFDETFYKEICFDRKPDIYFKVFHKDRLIHETKHETLWNVSDAETTVHINVDFSVDDQGPVTGDDYTVSGAVTTEDGKPFVNLIVRAFCISVGGENILGLPTHTDKAGQYRITYTEAGFRKPSNETGGADLVIRVYNPAGDNTQDIAESKIRNNAGQNETIDIQVKDLKELVPLSIQLKGAVLKRGVRDFTTFKIKIYNKTLLEGEQKIAETFPDQYGFYRLAVQDKNPLVFHKSFNLQARVYFGSQLVGESGLVYNLATDTTLNIFITEDTSKSLEPEYDLLKSHLAMNYAGTLTELKEDDNHDQISQLAQVSGWDARLVAMAVRAEGLAENTDVEPQHYYALFRAGVSSDAKKLSALTTEQILETLRQAEKNNIIAATTIEEGTATAIQDTFTHALLKQTNLQSMLMLSLGEEQINQFLTHYQDHKNDPETFWASLKDIGFNADTVSKLRLDGQLGYLTGQNIPVIEKIYHQHELNDPEDLVRNGFYKPDTWQNFVDEDAPAGVTKEDYSQYLAAMLQISYPTLVMAEMISNEEVILSDNNSAQGLSDFLSVNHLQYTFGKSPISTWNGYDRLSTEVQQTAKISERIYRLSPSPEAMNTLGRLKLTSAYEITRFTKKRFLKKYSSEFESADVATQVYNAAANTQASMHYLFWGATGLGDPNSPMKKQMLGTKGGTQKPEVSKQFISLQANLQELMGNLDFCSCEHCRSVLSPAAYLVDILQFIDNKNVDDPSTDYPLHVLKNRRPDLEHILLSCENTNTILPYIDIVNEILEYYIVNESINGFLGFNVKEDALSAELLASPEFVKQEAYTPLKNAVYPAELPFDYWLEKLRLIFQAWESNLADFFVALGLPASARREMLTLSPAENNILTDIDFRQLPEYFGENGAITIAELNDKVVNAKSFSQKMQISYEQLFNLLKTKVINPHAGLIPLVNKLDIGIDVLNDFYSNPDIFPLDDHLSSGLELSEFDGDVSAWLIDKKSAIESIIVLAEIQDESDSDAEDQTDVCDLSKRKLSRLLPGSTVYELTEIDFHKLNRFIRLWRKTEWDINTFDQIAATFLPVSSDLFTLNSGDNEFIDTVFTILLARLANFTSIVQQYSLSSKKMLSWINLWNPDTSDTLRKELLAHLVKKEFSDIINLTAITGIDPIADDMEVDSPSLIQFLAILDKLKAARIAVKDVDYILRHHDELGKLAPSAEALFTDILALRAVLNGVDAKLAAAPDNPDFNFAREKIALVYDDETARIFFEFLTDTSFYSAAFDTTITDLPEAITNLYPKLVFDPFKKELHFSGQFLEGLSGDPLTDLLNTVDALTEPDVPGINSPAELNAYQVALKDAISSIHTQSEEHITEFFAFYPQLKLIYDNSKHLATPEEQTSLILAGVLEDLRRTLKDNALKATLASLLKEKPEIINAFSQGAEILHSTVPDPTNSILDDFIATQVQADLSNNGVQEFYITPLAGDDYLLFIKAPVGTTITLAVNGTVLINGVAITGSGGWGETNTAFSAVTGESVFAELTIANLDAGKTVELLWQSKGMAKTILPPERISLKSTVDIARQSLIRLQKASHLNTLLKLTAEEVIYFATQNSETTGFLNAIPFQEGVSAGDIKILWEQIEKLIYFKLLKKNNEPEANSWVQILQNPDIEQPPGRRMILSLTGWNEDDLNEALNRFSINSLNLNLLSNLRKVKDLLDAVAKTELPATGLLSWVVGSPDQALIQQIEESLKEKTDLDVWLKTIQSVNDIFRDRRRDAMVAYILHHQPPAPEIDTANKLYEYFLIDVEMTACMKTSRIKQAILTVQLFIQRCLMNLEPEVEPDQIEAEQWEWMKRYRIWEANRKIFLYPENWLEPEFRLDKSFLYKEMEGKLLQSDINMELAEEVFSNYIKQLDDIARLDIVGTYLEENIKGDPTKEKLHVIARTNGNTRQYYYRKYDEYERWSAWEKITANIEGDHIMPIVWKNRLFIFWLNIIEKTIEPAEQNMNTMATHWQTHKKTNVEININWAEYYQGQWVSPKSSELHDPIIFESLTNFESQSLQIIATKREKTDTFPEVLTLHLYYEPSGSWWHYMTDFVSKNIPPDNTADQDWAIHDGFYNKVEEYFNGNYINEKISRGANSFIVNVEQPGSGTTTVTVLIKCLRGSKITPVKHPTSKFREAPFFYEDDRAAFFVKTKERFYTIPGFLGYPELFEIPEFLLEFPPVIPEPIPDWWKDGINIIPEFGPDPRVTDPIPNQTKVTQFDRYVQQVDNKLQTQQTFEHQGVMFGPGGKVNIGINTTG